MGITGLTSRVAAGLALAAMLAAGLARADEAAANLTAQHLYAGTLAAGDQALAALVTANPANNEARFGLGMIRFVRAVEHLSQGLYRYGPRQVESMMLPIIRLPVPENPNPQPVDYDAFRGLIRTFGEDLAAAEKTLADLGPGEVKVPIDLLKVRYDANGDGRAADDELFAAVVAEVTGMDLDDLPDAAVVAFDRGDVFWLRGYCHVLMSLTDFLMAHDWREAFEASFQAIFPRPNWPFARALDPNQANDFYREGGTIADFVSFIHLLHWQVTDPPRMKAVREHLKQVIAMSRLSWDAILAETDNDREWVPSPRQTSHLARLEVTPDRIEAWRTMLTEAEKALDGTLLVPHWRFRQGFNLRKVFDEPRTFDLVLWITGPAAAPYLEDGPVTTQQNWALMLRAFRGDFASYLVWFN